MAAVVLVAAVLHLAVFRPDVTIHAQVFGGPLDEVLASSFVVGAVGAGGQLTVTDAAVAPAGPGLAYVVGKVRLITEGLENGYRLGQEFVQVGHPLSLRLPAGVVDVRVLGIDDRRALAWREVHSTGAFVARGVAASPAAALAPGRLVALDGARFLRLTEVALLPTAPGQADAYLRGDVVQPEGIALGASGTGAFAPPSLQVPLVEDPVAAGTSAALMRVPVRLAVLRTPPLAPLPGVGSFEVVDGLTLVTVRDVTPVRRWAAPGEGQALPDATAAEEDWVDMEVLAAPRGSGYERGGAALLAGGPFEAAAGGTLLRGTVLRVGEAPPGAWREATLRAEGLTPAVADRIAAGAVERSAAGSVLAEVLETSVAAEPGGTREVVFRARLWAEEGPGGPWFKGTPLLPGERLAVFPGGTAVMATVVP